jgi:hypothetical protein
MPLSKQDWLSPKYNTQSNQIPDNENILSAIYEGMELYKNNQWISVEDGLPELETKVIVIRPNKYSGKNDVLMAYLHDSGEQGRSCGKMFEFDWLYGKYWSLPAVVKLNAITHWMPLPKEPK